MHDKVDVLWCAEEREFLVHLCGDGGGGHERQPAVEASLPNAHEDKHLELSIFAHRVRCSVDFANEVTEEPIASLVHIGEFPGLTATEGILKVDLEAFHVVPDEHFVAEKSGGSETEDTRVNWKVLN